MKQFFFLLLANDPFICLLDQRNLILWIHLIFWFVLFLSHLSQWWNCLSKKTINCHKCHNRSYGVVVNFNIFKNQRSDYLSSVLSLQCDDVKKILATWLYILVICKNLNPSSYFVLRRLSLCRYLTDQLQKVYVVNETNKVGVTDQYWCFWDSS
jgi:hypothetical protein